MQKKANGDTIPQPVIRCMLFQVVPMSTRFCTLQGESVIAKILKHTKATFMLLLIKLINLGKSEDRERREKAWLRKTKKFIRGFFKNSWFISAQLLSRPKMNQLHCMCLVNIILLPWYEYLISNLLQPPVAVLSTGRC